MVKGIKLNNNLIKKERGLKKPDNNKAHAGKDHGIKKIVKTKDGEKENSLMEVDITSKPYTIKNANLGWANIKRIWKLTLKELHIALKLKQELNKEIALASKNSVEFLNGVSQEELSVFAPVMNQRKTTKTTPQAQQATTTIAAPA